MVKEMIKKFTPEQCMVSYKKHVLLKSVKGSSGGSNKGSSGQSDKGSSGQSDKGSSGSSKDSVEDVIKDLFAGQIMNGVKELILAGVNTILGNASIGEHEDTQCSLCGQTIRYCAWTRISIGGTLFPKQ